MKMQKPPRNIEDLTDSLAELYSEAINASNENPTEFIRIATATNVAGKLISTVKMKIAYAMARKESPEIKFMGSQRVLTHD